jgi:hypothetical protein
MGEQRVHDPVACQGVTGPDSEEHMAGGKAVSEVVREGTRGFGGFEIAFADHRRTREDGVPGSRTGVDPHDDLLDGFARPEGVLDRGPQRASVDSFGYGQHVRMRYQIDLMGRGQHDGHAVRYSVAGKEAHGRPASLPQETRELMVERGVPSDECDRPVSHQDT